ncbi:MAG: DUF58 domain-containing protein [Actinomycetota bacterium]
MPPAAGPARTPRASRLRPTRKALGLLVGAGALFLVGTNVQSGWLLVGTAGVLALLVVGIRAPALQCRGVEVERTICREVIAGSPIPVSYRLRRHRRSGAHLIVLEDRMCGAAGRTLVPRVPGRASAQATSVLPAAHRGVYAGGPIILSSGAPFGFAQAHVRLEVPGCLTVLPAFETLGGLPFLEGSGEGDPAPTSVRGPGHEFHAVREYRPGDSLRNVHWRTTARTGTLMVREFEKERPARALVVVHGSATGPSFGSRSSTSASRRSRFTNPSSPTADPSTGALDRACEAAASLTDLSLRLGHQVRLVCAGPASTVSYRATPPSGGPSSSGTMFPSAQIGDREVSELRPALHFLAAVDASEMPVNRLAALAAQGEEEGALALLIVAVTSSTQSDEVAAAAGSLRATGLATGVLLVCPGETIAESRARPFSGEDSQSLPGYPADVGACRNAHLLAGAARATGATVWVWESGQDLGDVLAGATSGSGT